MQDSWGNGGEEMGMSTSQWDPEDGDVWNSPTSQESSSSCNSWSNGPKKCPNKVSKHTCQKHICDLENIDVVEFATLT